MSNLLPAQRDSTPRRPLRAALASLVLPGLGQFYNGQLNRAIWIFLGFSLLCIPGLTLVALYLPVSMMMPTLALGLLLTLGLWIYAIADAWRTARNLQNYATQPWQISGVYVLVFIVCDLLALPFLTIYVRQHFVEPFRIPSSSMAPSVLAGDMIFADKRYNCPGCKQGVHRGDIAIFAYPNDRSVLYIKRVIGLPGDHVRLNGEQIQVNGQALGSPPAGTAAASGETSEAIDENAWQVRWHRDPALSENNVLPPSNRAAMPARAEYDQVIPDGYVFVMGDNRAHSVDSRAFGVVPLQDVVGKARQVWFSASAGGIRWDRLGLVLQ